MGLLLLAGTTSCSTDAMQDVVEESESDPSQEENPEEEPEGTEEPEAAPEFDPVGTVTLLNPELLDENYILVNDAGNNRAYLMDKEARLLHEWELTNNIGNDVHLQTDGTLLASLEADEPKITFGGQGGRLQRIAPDNTVLWEFNYSSPEAETHHDAERLPNGNILALVWERRPAAEALAAGFMLDMDVYPEAVIEVDPVTDEIVWEWHAWDHLVQEADPGAANFGVVADHPEKIDLNYVPREGTWHSENGDIMHANGLAYDPVNDLVLISVNFYSEVWVIDHSTTTAEAAGDTGGNYGKGGDLVYRFGNPDAYGNTGSRLFYNNHHPNLHAGGQSGKLLIFSNGGELEQSTVYELQLPANMELRAGADNEPEVLWSFTHPDLYAPRVSGADYLPNGNILITEGDYGLWEVTRDEEVVWRFEAEGFFWRGYHYLRDAPEIQALGIE